jgi:hypothetical protein
MGIKNTNYGRIGLLGLIAATFILAAIIHLSCEKGTESDNNPAGVLKKSSGCMDFIAAPKGELVPPCCSCVEYEYNGGTLAITHLGACFNCCTNIYAVITINQNLITIEEKESGGACHCNCLYQLDYEITNLPVGDYSIRFIELCHEEGDEALEFTVNLETEPIGEYCVDRNHYPWDEN